MPTSSCTNRLVNWNVESLFSRKPSPKTRRSVFVNQSPPTDHLDRKGRIKKQYIHNTNQVLTSKYTIITFLPRNLLEQFRRFANVFFLGVDILQLIPRFYLGSVTVVLFPLIFVLAVTAIKDGYEDIKRHQADKRVNHSTTLILFGDDWKNQNQTNGKLKTFVRGVLKPGKLRLPGSRGPGDDANIEFDNDDNNNNNNNDNNDSYEHRQGHQRSASGEPFTRDSSRACWKRTLWEDVRVGDFIKLKCDDSLPADILICATSEDDNEAFIETKNLDGETNLKSRRAVEGLQHLRDAEACAKSPPFRIDCDAPEVNMFRANGVVVMGGNGDDNGAAYPISMQTMLLRGSVLRNTQWVIGIVLYTGQDTKVVLNAGDTPSKRSRVEISMNLQVIINFTILLVISAVCGIADAIIEQRKYPQNAPWLFDDNRSGDNTRINGLITFVNGLIVFQDVIPISLYVTLEIVRTLQVSFIYADSEITYEKTGQATLARSWNLSDDLGQIEYIFSDKTGTLTQNLMVFRKCTVAGNLYQEDQDKEDTPVKSPDEKDKQILSTASSAVLASSSSIPLTTPSNPSSTESEHFKCLKLSQNLQRLNSNSNNNDINDPTFNEHIAFFMVLSICHTAIAAKDPNDKEQTKIKYNAQSPDEAALVQAAADAGFVFLGREREIVRIRTPYSVDALEFELLNILEFTSARRRMSVIVRRVGDSSLDVTAERKVYVFTKGADNAVYSRLREDEDEEMKIVTQQHLDQFASEGLRTLCLAYKILSASEYEDWVRRYDEAHVSLENRDENIEHISSEMETGFTLLGGTAIEDKLQDGVPETISDLKRAGIKIWLLTGDKLETAIAIGYSANLVAHDATLVIVRQGGDGAVSVEQQLIDAAYQFFPDSGIVEKAYALSTGQVDPESMQHRRQSMIRAAKETGEDESSSPNLLQKTEKSKSNFVLVINGAALEHALENPFTRELLLKIGIRCSAVICCGVSPLQKALVVNLVKDGLHTMTLAIGDGANDVSMIQTAHVGVGIRGEEGLQAVNSADYAIAQFRFLKRLLFVHGHWSYQRNGSLILNFFFKNIIYVILLWWFQIYCGWSTQSAVDGNYILFWNIVFTSLPVGAIGAFDRFIDERVLMAVPELYRYGREQKWYNFRIFTFYMLDGVLQSLIIFMFVTYAYFNTPSVRHDGFDSGYIFEFSTLMALAAVMTANFYIGLNTWAWTILVWIALLFGIIFVWAYSIAYAHSPNNTVYGNNHFLFTSPIFWLTLFFVIVMSLLPRYLYKAIQRTWYPTDYDILKELYRLNPNMDFSKLFMTDTGTNTAARVNAVPMQDLGESGSPSSYRRDSNRRSILADMSLGGEQVTNRGFGFAAEEGGGVHLQRMQSNLSEQRKLKAKNRFISGFKQTFRKMRSAPSKSNSSSHDA